LNELLISSNPAAADDAKPFMTDLEFSPIKGNNNANNNTNNNNNFFNSTGNENINFFLLDRQRNINKELFKDDNQQQIEKPEKQQLLQLLNPECSAANEDNKDEFDDAYYNKVNKKNSASHKLFSNLNAAVINNNIINPEESSPNNHFETQRYLIETKKNNNDKSMNKNSNNNNKKMFNNLKPNFNMKISFKKQQSNFAYVKPKSKNLFSTKFKSSANIVKKNNSKKNSENIQQHTESSYLNSYKSTEQNYQLNKFNSKPNYDKNINNNNKNIENLPNIQEKENNQEDLVDILQENTNKSQDEDYITNLLLNQNVVIVNNRYSSKFKSSKNLTDGDFRNLFSSKEKLKIRENKSPCKTLSNINTNNHNNNHNNKLNTMKKNKSSNSMLRDKGMSSNKDFLKSVENENCLSHNNNNNKITKSFNFIKNKNARTNPNPNENQSEDNENVHNNKIRKSSNSKSKNSLIVEKSKKEIFRNLELMNYNQKNQTESNLYRISNNNNKEEAINQLYNNCYPKQNSILEKFKAKNNKKKNYLSVNNYTHINNFINRDILNDYSFNLNKPRKFSNNKAYEYVKPRYMLSNPKRNATVDNLFITASEKKENLNNLIECDSRSNKTNGIKKHYKSTKDKIRNKSTQSFNNSMNYCNNNTNIINNNSFKIFNYKLKNLKSSNEYNSRSNLNGKSFDKKYFKSKNRNNNTKKNCNSNYNFSLADQGLNSNNNHNNIRSKKDFTKNKNLNFNRNECSIPNPNSLLTKIYNANDDNNINNYTHEANTVPNDYETRDKIISNKFSDQNKILEIFDNILKDLEVVQNKPLSTLSLVNPKNNNFNNISNNKYNISLNSNKELDLDVAANNSNNQKQNQNVNGTAKNHNIHNIDFENFMNNEFFDLSKTYMNKVNANKTILIQEKVNNKQNFNEKNLIKNSNINYNLLNTNEFNINNINNIDVSEKENSKSLKADKLIKNKYKNLIQNFFIDN